MAICANMASRIRIDYEHHLYMYFKVIPLSVFSYHMLQMVLLFDSVFQNICSFVMNVTI